MFVYNSDMISQDFHNKVAVCQVLINLRRLVSSAGRALACWEVAGSNPDRKNTQALKITEKQALPL